LAGLILEVTDFRNGEPRTMSRITSEHTARGTHCRTDSGSKASTVEGGMRDRDEEVNGEA